MARLHTHHPLASRRRQRGLTLVEFMVSITIGLFMVAAIATLIASQSGNRTEVDRSGRMIENGRYAVKTVTDELQMAGYWGELNGAPVDAALPVPPPDLCSLALADHSMLSQLHVQGWDDPAAANVPACIPEQQPGTDILVMRHADPDTASLETGGVADMSKLTAGQLYIQTGLNVAGASFAGTMAFGTADATANGNLFTLKKKNKVTTASVRRFAVRVYYIAKCSVPAGGSCAAGDGGNPIPTLKMVELTADAGAPAWSAPVTLAEGIENMQVEYGVDTDLDGTPNGDDVTMVATPEDWKNVMTVKIHLLARSLEPSPGYQDEKTYNLGADTSFTPTSVQEKAFKRHVFVQSVRLVNPGARRQS